MNIKIYIYVYSSLTPCQLNEKQSHANNEISLLVFIAKKKITEY